MIKITVEELEIIVEASVKGALNEFKKLRPGIQKAVSQVSTELNKVDTKGLTGQIRQASKKVKKDIKEMFDPNDISDLKIDGKMFDIKNIKGYSKELQNLKGQIGELNRFKIDNPQINMPKAQNSITSQNNTQSIEPARNTLNLWDQLRIKIQETRGWISKNVGFSFVNQLRRDIRQTSAEEELLKNKINELKATLNTVNNGRGPKFDTNEILKMEAELEKLQSKLDKIEEEKERKYFFKDAF